MPHVTVCDSSDASFEVALEPRLVCTLGRPSEGVTFRDWPKVQRDTSGRFYLTDRRLNQHTVTVWEPDGRFVRTIGQFGNEFLEWIGDIHIAPDDSLVVMHDDRWVSVFDPAGTFVQDFQLEGPITPIMSSLIGYRDRRILVGVASTGAALPPLQLYDEHGRLERSFGPHEFGAREAGRSSWGPRVAAEWADDRSIWLAGPGYRIERCDLDGQINRVIGVSGPSDWYTDWSPRLFMTEDEFLASKRARAANRPPAPTPQEWRAQHPEPFVVVPKPLPLIVAGLKQKGQSLLVAAHSFYGGTPSDPLPRWVVDLNAGCGQPRTMSELDFHFSVRNTVLDLLDIASGVVRGRVAIRGRCYLTSDGTVWRPCVREDVVQIETFDLIIRERPTDG